MRLNMMDTLHSTPEIGQSQSHRLDLSFPKELLYAWSLILLQTSSSDVTKIYSEITMPRSRAMVVKIGTQMIQREGESSRKKV